MAGCIADKVAEKKAERIFNLMEEFAGYGFNKSHSCAYALLAYQTAYLKVHYPVEFMAALLTSDAGNTDKTVKYINEARGMSISILPPDVNESDLYFTPVDEAIRFGLAAIKNVEKTPPRRFASHAWRRESFARFTIFASESSRGFSTSAYLKALSSPALWILWAPAKAWPPPSTTP